VNQDPAAAEDVVQVTLVKAIGGLRTFRGEASLFTWLCTICRREIASYHERRGRRPETVPLVEDIPGVRAALESLAAAPEGNPEIAVRRTEVARRVQVTLDALPPAYGDALEWKYVYGFSVAEIAGRLEVGVKAAESLLTRARQAFRDGFAAIDAGVGEPGPEGR
jgi:RNA polymerase sigma-70 factor (ECF subfamily)